MGVIILSDKPHGEFTPHDEAILVQLAQAALCPLKRSPNQSQKEGQERLWATRSRNIGIGGPTPLAGSLWSTAVLCHYRLLRP